MAVRPTAADLDRFFEQYDGDAAEIIWTAALGMIEKAVIEARQTSSSRWRYFPGGELRRLRDELASALSLARFAAALEEDANERERKLAAGSEAALDEELRRRRRSGTEQAERVRTGRSSRRGDLEATDPPPAS